MSYAYRGTTSHGASDYYWFPRATKEDVMLHACRQLASGATGVSIEDDDGRPVADEREIRDYCQRAK
jgi:hypothetical protein